MAPSLDGFVTFVRNVMGIPTNYLPDDSPSFLHAYDHALDTVNRDLIAATGQRTSWSPYELAVYNLAGHLLIEFAPDQSYAISALSWSAGFATATTTAANQILPGDRVSIQRVSPLGYSGPQNLGYVTVQATPDNTHFSYALSPNPGTATVLSGAAAVEQFFQRLRQQFKMTQFAPGVVASSSDVSTAVGLDNPKFLQGLTIEDLQLLKTPYGRAYLGLAQKYGPSIWGLS